ncbi:MAG: ABC transporter ATP-binding protein, partial [Anaerolineales bacterium]|nr:ABC transporter ATP-binding protein [Anaerolineales bacterium]
MIRIARYLRPYLLMFVASVILLYIQAQLDLALPDYLSQIVNTGIQQNGVESPVPSAIRQSEMERVTLFLTDADKTAVLNAYTLLEPGSPAAAPYLEQYPLLADEPVYVLKDLTPDAKDALTQPLAKALLVVSALEQAAADPEKAAQFGGGPFDLSKLPPGMDLFTLLGQLPASQRAEISNSINEQFASLDEKMLNQSAAVAVKAEYEALGVDIGLLQTNYVLRVGAIMLGVTLLSVMCTITVGYLSAKIAAGVGHDLRRDVFKKVESFSNAEFDKIPTASLITRSTNDITQLQMVTMFMVRLVFYAPIMGFGGIIRAAGKGSSMWWTIALAVVVLVSVIVTVMVISLPKFRIMQKLIDRLNLVARENLSGMMVIRAFNMQGFEEDRFDKANLDLTANTLFITRVMAIMMPIMMMIMNVLTV